MTGFPGRLTCPICDRTGLSAEEGNVPHFWRFQEVKVGEEPRWLLGLVCEAHHHWVIEIVSGEAEMTARTRPVPCPDLRTCGWNPENWRHFLH
jgi:hypothetical protein